jgi:hypothetical protein
VQLNVPQLEAQSRLTRAVAYVYFLDQHRVHIRYLIAAVTCGTRPVQFNVMLIYAVALSIL